MWTTRDGESLANSLAGLGFLFSQPQQGHGMTRTNLRSPLVLKVVLQSQIMIRSSSHVQVRLGRRKHDHDANLPHYVCVILFCVSPWTLNPFLWIFMVFLPQGFFSCLTSAIALDSPCRNEMNILFTSKRLRTRILSGARRLSFSAPRAGNISSRSIYT